jgi:uncharacterized membrane protein YjgN (DUF898 family)
MSNVDALNPAPADGVVRFLGNDRAYWRLLVRGAVLLLVTLGLYRFWLATDIRRFLWSHTEIAGDTLEYNGLATELLIGFLVAVAILVPVYIGFFVLAIEFGPAAEMSGALGLLLLALFGNFAIYRARRYRLTRTVFRGLRFNQSGSAFIYAVLALFWWFMIALTLGLAYPWAQASLQRYKMRRTSYGDLPGRFEGSGSSLFVRGFPMWLLVMGPLLFGAAAMVRLVDWQALSGSIARGDRDALDRLETSSPEFALAIGVGLTSIAAAAAAALLFYPVFQALMLRWWTSGLRFGPLTVTSHLSTGPVYRVYLRFLAYALVFALAALVMGAIGLAVIGLLLGSVQNSRLSEYLATAIVVGEYVVVALGFSTIYQVVVKFGLWRLGAQSLELSGTDALDSVRAAGTPSSAVGEGLADALNVGGI